MVLIRAAEHQERTMFTANTLKWYYALSVDDMMDLPLVVLAE